MMPATSRKPRPVVLGNVQVQKAQPTKQMKDLAASMYTHNRGMNAEQSAYNRARKSLFSEMAKENLRHFEMKAIGDTGTITLDVNIIAPETEAMDVRKLFEYIGCEVPKTKSGKDLLEKFFETVTATKTNVEKIHGKGMSARIAYPKIGDENVVVKPKEG